MSLIRQTRPWLLLLSLALLGGCATMSADECRVADWYLIGEMDARSGRTPAYFAQRDRDCREAGHPADQPSWRAGWEEGLSLFCTAPQGFRFGREGNRYEPICPAALEVDFLQGYVPGRELHEVETRLQALRGELGRIETSLRQARRKDKLTAEEVEDLERQRDGLARQLRSAELQGAELQGMARGRGLL